MLLKRKLFVAAVFCGILFLMIATHTIQRNNILSLPRHLGLADGPAPSSPTPAVRGPDGGKQAQPSSLPSPGPSSLKTDLAVARVCGCPSCVGDVGTSEWFGKRYDPKQQPFLLDHGGSLNPLDLRWWLALQRSGDDQTLQEVKEKMFQVISSPSLDVAPHPNQCRTCAVVGNSGNLLGASYGKLIDTHNTVIRMNKAVTVGFEEHVGNRTTHHLMYPESAVDLSNGVHLVLVPFKLRDLQWVASALSTGEIKTTYMRVKDRVRADKDKVIVVNPLFFKYAHDNWNEAHGRYPSTGMLAIIFALHICDQVSVFGYGADQHGNWHHYWEENRNAGAFRKTGVHSADFETQVIHRLDDEGKIRLHT
ncbi:ST3 beta-galactoside alpha-2,3-sialyltransferase 8 [Osmerus eperlanus]|uniref:ST3 beta-galactoside alpha-2,3-sialyltransferase 8 n=1 Tax=Osmerus eperlanus TaxID=29151 RepID=UPI002E13A3C7